VSTVGPYYSTNDPLYYDSVALHRRGDPIYLCPGQAITVDTCMTGSDGHGDTYGGLTGNVTLDLWGGVGNEHLASVPSGGCNPYSRGSLQYYWTQGLASVQSATYNEMVVFIAAS
jgi:hypothetical protein